MLSVYAVDVVFLNSIWNSSDSKLPQDGDETFHELMQPSIVAAVGVSRALEAKGDGANVARKVGRTKYYSKMY